MKKLVLSSVLICCLGISGSFSQNDNGGRVSSREARSKVVFGFKGGFNRSNVFDQKRRDFVADGRTGAVVGGFMCIPFGGFIGFQPEVLFSQKGFSGVGEIAGYTYHLDRTTNHIDVPLQLQLKPFGWMSMLAGLQYSYLLSQKDEISVNNKQEEVVQQFNNDNIRKNLLGFVMGGDINFWHVVISGRAGWDMIANHGDGNSSTPRYKNFWFQGTLGYRVY